MDDETVTISRELLDMMVSVMKDVPYIQVAGVFAKLRHEMEKDEPKIVT